MNKPTFKARVAAETLSDDSIVFNVVHGVNIIASPATQAEAERICDDWNAKHFPTKLTGHTCPPWFVTADAKVVDSDGNVVAICPRYGAGRVTEGRVAPWHCAEANARLISAVHELLISAGMALSALEGQKAADDGYTVHTKAIEALKSAIKKAHH